MKLVRFQYHRKNFWGTIKGEVVYILKNPPYEKISLSNRSIPLEKVKLLAPTDSGKIILAGLNYRDHAKELKMAIPKEPIIFLKPSSALIANNQVIVYPQGVKRLDYEAELALVIRKKAAIFKGRRPESIY